MSSANSNYLKIGGAVAASVGALFFLHRHCCKPKASCCAPKGRCPMNPNASASDFNPHNPKLTLSNDDQIKEFLRVYPSLVEQFISFARREYKLPESALQRLDRMFQYNIIGGKYNRACLVTNTVQIVAKWKKLNIDQYWEQALVLGWAIEILQALFLVADDIMDGSITRRGQPCWYKQEDVKMDAINDTLILESFLFFLLNEHFANHPNFVPIVQLYQSVSLQTQLGQMLDLLSQPQGRKGPEILNQFSLEVYERIVCYKTAIYTFYLPLAAGLLVTNVVGSDSEELKVCRELSIDLGTKFQIEDDYLDCYGAPEVIGKIGTDIKDHKCSWLVVQALKRVNAAQKKMLEENYGHEEKECEDRVKALYRELKLEAVYEKQEDDSYAAIEAKVAKYANKLPGDLFLPILKKIHKRIK